MGLVFLGCSKREEGQMQFNEKEVLKISVFISGEILADNKRVSLDDLDTLLAANAQDNGVVWYYRENAAGEPPPEAMSVMEAVVNEGLPIKLSTKPDFSDSVGPNGM